MAKTTKTSTEAAFISEGIPMPILHMLLERLAKDWIADYRKGNTGAVPRHPAFLVAHYKGLRVTRRVKAVSPGGQALRLLKTQYAKKPKNPV